jgi:hypothetical protein
VRDRKALSHPIFATLSNQYIWFLANIIDIFAISC